MNNEAWWMSPQTLDQYNKILHDLNQGIKEHRRLIEKLRKKKITESDLKNLKKVMDIVNKLDKQRRLILEKNPLKTNNILKMLKAQEK